MEKTLWAGTSIEAYVYTPAATPRQLRQYREELELDTLRRNTTLTKIEPLPGIALPSASSE